MNHAARLGRHAVKCTRHGLSAAQVQHSSTFNMVSYHSYQISLKAICPNICLKLFNTRFLMHSQDLKLKDLKT